MLALIKAARGERFVISELVRMAITSIAVTINWEILQSPNLTDEQLAELQRDWASLEFIQSEEHALAMERFTGQITTAKWRRSNSELLRYLDAWNNLGLTNEKDATLDGLKVKTKVFMWRYWWSYPDELRAQKGYEVLLETPRFAETNYSFQMALQKQESRLKGLGINTNADTIGWLMDPAKTDTHSMLSQDVLTLRVVFNKVMRAETAKQMTETAIALKRYQLKYGKYPMDLDSLVPEFVSAVPLDPVDGQPLRYRLNSDGTFLLYSVGDNGKDDGGDPSLGKGVTSSSFYWQNPHALDWVWPQPATAEEIQAYYDRQKSGK
jgi:hypothetical protein